jgi:hypothetical protein
MRKALVILAALMVGSLGWAAAWMGRGEIVTVATGTISTVSSLEANMVSVYNASGTTTGVVYVLVNSDAATFATRVTATNCVPIPVGQSFTFDVRQRGIIQNVFIWAVSGTNTVYVGAY